MRLVVSIEMMIWERRGLVEIGCWIGWWEGEECFEVDEVGIKYECSEVYAPVVDVVVWVSD